MEDHSLIELKNLTLQFSWPEKIRSNCKRIKFPAKMIKIVSNILIGSILTRLDNIRMQRTLNSRGDESHQSIESLAKLCHVPVFRASASNASMVFSAQIPPVAFITTST